MKITCNKEELSQVCQISRRMAGNNKTSSPVLEGILITAKSGILTFTGYNLELGVKSSISAEIKEEGEILVNVGILDDMVKKLPENTVNIESDKTNTVKISSGNFESTLIGMSAGDYPALPSVTNGSAFSINQKVLRDMIKKTIFSVAVKDSKIVHTGIKFEIEPNHIRLIAVDGVRLAIRNEIINYDGENLSFVVPAKTLSEIIKLIGNNDEDIYLSIGQKHIIFLVGNYTIFSRLLSGEFLNYKAVITSSKNTVADVNTKSLVESIDRTALLITDKVKSPVKCCFDGNLIKVSCSTTIGTTNDKITAKIQGEPCTIGFNNKYMLDALKVCDIDEVRIILNGSTAPILIVPKQGDEFIFLILPVKLREGVN